MAGAGRVGEEMFTTSSVAVHDGHVPLELDLLDPSPLNNMQNSFLFFITKYTDLIGPGHRSKGKKEWPKRRDRKNLNDVDVKISPL